MGYYIVTDLTDEAIAGQKPCTHKDCGKPLTAGIAFYFKQVQPEILHQCVQCAFKE